MYKKFWGGLPLIGLVYGNLAGDRGFFPTICEIEVCFKGVRQFGFFMGLGTRKARILPFNAGPRGAVFGVTRFLLVETMFSSNPVCWAGIISRDHWVEE